MTGRDRPAWTGRYGPEHGPQLPWWRDAARIWRARGRHVGALGEAHRRWADRHVAANALLGVVAISCVVAVIAVVVATTTWPAGPAPEPGPPRELVTGDVASACLPDSGMRLYRALPGRAPFAVAYTGDLAADNPHACRRNR